MKDYIFLCMNAVLDCKVLEFKTDEEAIAFGSNYEAEIYEVDFEIRYHDINGESTPIKHPILVRLVYDPYDVFN